MPESRVRRTAPAERDLLEIWLYLAERNREMRTADRLVRRIDEKLTLLAEFPGMGRARPEFGAGVRTFPVESYLIVYRRIADGIELLRVVHGARDLRRLLGDREP